MALSKTVRFEVFKRDSFTCRYCGHSPPDVKLEVDHVIARASGGSDDMANLVTSCFACNRGKSDKPLGTSLPPVDQMALRAEMQEALERAYNMKAAMAVANEEAAVFSDAVKDASEYCERTLDCYVQAQSMSKFVKCIPIDQLYELIRDVASRCRPSMDRQDRWKYFCGACWRVIRSTAEGAA